MQSTLNSVTQSMQWMRVWVSVIAPAHEEPPGTTTVSHCTHRPISATEKSLSGPISAALHVLFFPQQALAIAASPCAAALAIAGCAVAASGQGPGTFPLSTLFQQLCRAFDFATKNLAALLPIAC